MFIKPQSFRDWFIECCVSLLSIIIMYYLISGVFRSGLGILNCSLVKETHASGGSKDRTLRVLSFKDHGPYCISVTVSCVSTNRNRFIKENWTNKSSFFLSIYLGQILNFVEIWPFNLLIKKFRSHRIIDFLNERLTSLYYLILFIITACIYYGYWKSWFYDFIWTENKKGNDNFGIKFLNDIFNLF